MSTSRELVIVVCPPLSQYKEAPADHSHSELFDCPKCNQKMWLSQKKKGVLAFASCIDKNILLACYDCFTKEVEKDPGLVMDAENIRL